MLLLILFICCANRKTSKLSSHVVPILMLQGSANLENMVAAALSGSLASLTRARGASGLSGHLWMRLALISADKTAAALYDDLGQVRDGSWLVECGFGCMISGRDLGTRFGVWGFLGSG
jgi:hypothetical protein